MKVIIPVKITDAEFVSSTVAEDDFPEWNSATAYTIGTRVMLAARHEIYEAVTDHTNKPPATSPNEWLLVGATNRWAMFDDKVGTATTAAESLTVTISPGLVSALALVNVSASSVRVVITDPADGVVLDRTDALYDVSAITDWWAYFFESVDRKTLHIMKGLPGYAAATIAITLTGGEVSLGALVVGSLRHYARAAQRGASVSIQDYSRKERDDWGSTIITERAFAKRASWRFIIDNALIDAMQRQLAGLRARSALYIGSDAYEATVIYGFYRDFSIVIAHPHHAECSIEIEGLT